MLRILTTARLNALTARAEDAEGNAAACQKRASDVTSQLAVAHADLAAADQAGQKLLKDLVERSLEVAELIEEVKAAERAPELVYVLSRYGELHSVHTSRASAEAAAYANGAPTNEWAPTRPGTPLSESHWRVTGIYLTRGEAA